MLCRLWIYIISDKLCKIYILVFICLLHNNLLVLIHKAIKCTFCNYYNTMIFFLGPFNNLLINTMLSIYLKWNFRNYTHVDVTTRQCCVHCKCSVMFSHYFNDPQTVLGRFSLYISRSNERNCLCNCSFKPKWSVKERYIIINTWRNSNYLNLNIFSSKYFMNLVKLMRFMTTSNQVKLSNTLLY